MGHTKEPMIIMECGAIRINIGSEQNILLFGDNAENNAERILTCWDSHDELLAACQEAKLRIAFLLRKIVDSKVSPIIDNIEIRKTAVCIDFLQAAIAGVDNGN